MGGISFQVHEAKVAALKAEIERLLAALQTIVDMNGGIYTVFERGSGDDRMANAVALARIVLSDQQQERDTK